MTIRILTTAECSQAIGRISAAGKVLQARVHTVAVSTLAHIRDHGDTTLAARLLDALPNGQRVNALAFWFGHYSNGKAKFSKDKAGAWKCNLSGERTQADFDIEGADATCFADLTKEKAVETMTLAALEKLLTKIADNGDSFHPGTTIPKYDRKVVIMASRLVASLREQAPAIAA